MCVVWCVLCVLCVVCVVWCVLCVLCVVCCVCCVWCVVWCCVVLCCVVLCVVLCVLCGYVCVVCCVLCVVWVCVCCVLCVVWVCMCCVLCVVCVYVCSVVCCVCCVCMYVLCVVLCVYVCVYDATFLTLSRGMLRALRRWGCTCKCSGWTPSGSRSLSSTFDLPSQRDAQPPIIVPSRTESTVVLWLHGLGDTGDGWAPIGRMMHSEFNLPSVTWIFPTAHAISVSLNLGVNMPAWFDIPNLGERDLPLEGIEESADYVTLLLEKIATQKAAGDTKVVLGGFSQGGALAIYTAYSRPVPKLSGVIGHSCYAVGGFEALRNTDVPLLFVHGDIDPVIPMTWAKQSMEQLKEAGVKDIRFHSIPGLDHGANPASLHVVRDFLPRA